MADADKPEDRHEGCDCDHPSPGPPAPEAPKKDLEPRNDPALRPKAPKAPLRRYPEAGWLGGVCAGIAYELDLPTWMLRLAWFMLVITFGVGVMAYIILWIFVPKGEVPLDHEWRIENDRR